MFSLFDYIMKIFDKYNNFNEYFVGEIGNSITIFQYINSCLLFLYFVGLIFRFFVIKFGFKVCLIFIIKRLIFLLFFSYGIYVSSDFTLCNTSVNRSVNKNLNAYSSNLTDNQKTYIAIGCFLVIGTYLVYKSLVKLEAYDKYNINKKNFESTFGLNETFLQKTIESNNIKILLCNKNFEKVNLFSTYILERFLQMDIKKFKENIILLNESLSRKYENIRRFNPHLPELNLLQTKHNLVENKLDIIVAKLYSIVGDGNKKALPFYCDFDLLLEKKRELVFELIALNKLYDGIVTKIVNEPAINPEYYQQVVDASIQVDRKLSSIIEASDKLIPVLESIHLIYGLPGTPGTALYYVGRNGILNPDLYDLEGCLTGVQFFFLNTGYVTLYPLFFVCNKILGVYNPLSFTTFKDSIWYFITLKMFF